MRISNRTTLIIAVVLSLSMALVQTVGASIPFKGRGSGDITNVQPMPTGVLLTGVGTGEATHLGRFSRVENILLNPADNTFTGDVTFTAANGDQLTAMITGAFTSAVEASGSYTFVGGSGRFVNASGTAYFSATLTSPVTFTFNFAGSLDN